MSRGEEVMLDDVVLIDTAPTPEAVLLARERNARLSICLGRLCERDAPAVTSENVAEAAEWIGRLHGPNDRHDDEAPVSRSPNANARSCRITFGVTHRDRTHEIKSWYGLREMFK